LFLLPKATLFAAQKQCVVPAHKQCISSVRKHDDVLVNLLRNRTLLLFRTLLLPKVKNMVVSRSETSLLRKIKILALLG